MKISTTSRHKRVFICLPFQFDCKFDLMLWRNVNVYILKSKIKHGFDSLITPTVLIIHDNKVFE